MEQIPAVIRMEDYKLEELLRCPERFAKMQSGGQRKVDVSWRQMAQFAACHSVDDYFKLPAQSRTEEAVETAVEHWWTNRHYKFHSNEHYLQSKHSVISNLTAFLVDEKCCSTPIIVFEQLTAYVEELDMELSQIFHLVSADEAGGVSDYIIQKFVADENKDTLDLLYHMTSVFCASAFGKLPSRIEVLSVLNGNRQLFVPNEATLEQSLDYMQLVKSLLPDANVFEPSSTRALQHVM